MSQGVTMQMLSGGPEMSGSLPLCRAEDVEAGGRSVLRPPGVGASRGNRLLLGASRGEQVSEWGGPGQQTPGSSGSAWPA